jgi:hypothetical protein
MQTKQQQLKGFHFVCAVFRVSVEFQVEPWYWCHIAIILWFKFKVSCSSLNVEQPAGKPASYVAKLGQVSGLRCSSVPLNSCILNSEPAKIRAFCHVVSWSPKTLMFNSCQRVSSCIVPWSALKQSERTENLLYPLWTCCSFVLCFVGVSFLLLFRFCTEFVSIFCLCMFLGRFIHIRRRGGRKGGKWERGRVAARVGV